MSDFGDEVMFKTIRVSEFDTKFPKTKTTKSGLVLYRVFAPNGEPVYVSIPKETK